MSNKGLQWHKKRFSVGLYSRSYEKNYNKAFRKTPKDYSVLLKILVLLLGLITLLILSP